jgi:hypothetical protein
MSNNIGFIILRHVNNYITSKYYLAAYNSIRKYYPENKIVIIDDNSNYSFIDNNEENNLYNTLVVRSEFKGRGELLPYIYYLRHNFFETAIIIQDSVFINSKLNLDINNYKFIWDFEHDWDNSKDELRIISYLDNNEELQEFYKNKDLWKGCFGGMMIINYDYLKKLDDRYNIKLLIEAIHCRNERCYFERVIACIMQINEIQPTLLGSIHKYCNWGIKYSDDIFVNSSLPIIKVWTGR